MISLPECWNSPYAVDCFPVYAEPVPAVGGTADPKVSPSAAMVIQVRFTVAFAFSVLAVGA